MIIRVEADRKKGKDVCAITLANPEELHAFFKGLRRIVEALGHNIELMEGGSRMPSVKTRQTEARGDERDALVLKARQKKNAQAFTPWTKEEEQEIRRATPRQIKYWIATALEEMRGALGIEK